MEQYYFKDKKILLVDDEKALLDMISDFLREDGYSQVKTADSVQSALDTARQWQPDMAVLDVMLPDGDGFSLFEKIREFTNIPVLFLTAKGKMRTGFTVLALGLTTIW